MNGGGGALGGVAQASIPALYAWAVTVAPVAWGRGGSTLSAALALAALAALPLSLYLDARRTKLARPVLVWGFVVPSALAWVATPAAFSASRWDLVRGLGGMLGWGLFALSAASAPRAAGSVAHPAEAPPLRPRRPLARGDGLWMGVAVAAACSLQAIGWSLPAGDPERRVLVRVVALGAALLLLGAVAAVLVARHGRRQSRPPRERLKSSLPWLALFAVLLGAAVALRLFR